MSNAGEVEETEKSLEKKLEEAMEQLKAKDGELQKEKEEGREKEREKERELQLKDAELKMKNEELMKTREELNKEREERMERERELEKLRRQTPGKIGCVDEGSKKWEMEVEKIGEERSFSDYIYIGGVPFRIVYWTDTVAGVKNLSVYLRCNDKAPTTTFSASVDFTLTLASTVTPEIKSLIHNYTSAKGHGWRAFIAWTDLIDRSKGYIQNGRITIEAKIKLICFYKNAFYDPSSPDLQLTDVTLVVGGMEFNVCKKHFAIYSNFFKTLFLSDFAEKDKERVDLPEVDAKEFKDLLRMIHPKRNTTVGNVEYLLHLADYFIVDVVRWQCIDFLKGSADFSLAAKLKLTEQYRLPELQADILEKMTTRETVKGVIDSPEFKSYSDPLKNFVLQKHYTLL